MNIPGGRVRAVGPATAPYSQRSIGQKVRIFVGTEPKTEIARKVLEFSIRRRTECEVEFTPMIGPTWEYPHADLRVGTGFSLRRWMIPFACGWKGYAIYLDADQLVFGDIAELWFGGIDAIAPSGNKAVVACTWQPDKYYPHPAPQTAVMVIDCERAKTYWQFHIDKVLPKLRIAPDRTEYVKLMHAEGLPVAGPLPTPWNHLNVYKEGKTRLLHYTKEPEQPWYRPDHALADLWRREFQAAVSSDVVTGDEITKAVSQFNVKEDWRNTNGLHPDYLRFVPKTKKK